MLHTNNNTHAHVTDASPLHVQRLAQVSTINRLKIADFFNQLTAYFLTFQSRGWYAVVCTRRFVSDSTASSEQRKTQTKPRYGNR